MEDRWSPRCFHLIAGTLKLLTAFFLNPLAAITRLRSRSFSRILIFSEKLSDASFARSSGLLIGGLQGQRSSFSSSSSFFCAEYLAIQRLTSRPMLPFCAGVSRAISFSASAWLSCEPNRAPVLSQTAACSRLSHLVVW